MQKQIQKRQLGNSGLEVSAIGLGCMSMTSGYGPAAEKDKMISLIRSAVDLGVTFFDTAEAYGPFANERLVGRAIRGRRDSVVLATKFGNERRADGAWVGVNGRPEYVRSACDASLLRLGVDVIGRQRHRKARRRPGRDAADGAGALQAA